MSNGYTGKILKVDLTARKVEEIPTSKYEKWVGGHGMATAVFWDLCEDKTVAGTDPKNVVSIMTSPTSGTLVPSGTGRTEMTGIGLQGYPVPWYTRSNFGGRFGTQLKMAGWDGIAIVGKASNKVWVKIVDDKISFEDAEDLWALDTWETQEEIWAAQVKVEEGDWRELGHSRDGGRTTQRPAVLTCGPKAENYGPISSLVHDAAFVAGQGGFGGVFASKNLKAISVVGTHSIGVADPQALMEARLWSKEYTWGGHADNPNHYVGMQGISSPPGNSLRFVGEGVKSRPAGCAGCVRACRGRTGDTFGNEGMCIGFHWFTPQDKAAHNGFITSNTGQAANALNRHGMNANTFMPMTIWFLRLRAQGLIGKGKAIDSNLPFEKMGSIEFINALLDSIVNLTDIGADLAQGLPQAAKKWGRWEMDTESGLLPVQEYGYGHHYDPRTTADWGFASILTERDINSHDLDFPCYWTPTLNAVQGREPDVSAPRLAEIMAKKLVPFNDPMMIDYSDEGIYSESAVKAVAWLIYYNRFWKNTVNLCDWAWADFVNPYGPNYEGMTPEGEPKFYKAVTGDDITFKSGMEIGRKVFNLDRAIWALQGRVREQEVFSGYVYDVPASIGQSSYELPYTLPVYLDGQWQFKDVSGRKLDRQKVEDFKTLFYKFEGWDPKTGRPTRASLEKLDLGNVADELERAGKLGQA